MNIINLHSNDVVVYVNEHTSPIVFEAEGPIQVRMKVEDITPNGIIKRGYWTHTRNIPPQAPETLYIVSSLVAMFELYENNRLDLLFPWGMVRSHEGQGQVIACRALCRPQRPPSKEA